MTFRKLSDSIMNAAARGQYEMRGAGAMGATFDFAWEKMRARMVKAGYAEVAVNAALNNAKIAIQLGNELCESPIERTLLPGLVCADYGAVTEEPARMHDPRREMMPEGPLVIIPQFAFARARMDFAIVARFKGRMQFFCIECDGREYHAGSRDIIRDGYFASWGIPTVRLKGAEIYEDPLAAAQRATGMVFSWSSQYA